MSPYALGVHLRGAVAAAAGVCAAATAHALDASGRLPFVHESLDVRAAMSPVQVAIWLALAAAVSALAAGTRVLRVGVPGALLVSATPELLSRHDPGAIAEPGAVLGALVQVLLLITVVAVALVLERWLPPLRVRRLAGLPHVVPCLPLPAVVRRAVDRTAAPRGPPECVQSTT